MRTFKKFIFFSLLAIVSMITTQSCSRVKVDAGEEAVLVHKPMFFGNGGIDKKPIPTGSQWTWATTDNVNFKIIPIRYTENLNDVASNENTPLDFNTQILIQIQKGKTPILLQNYGVDWYKNNIQETYNNYTRNYVSKYSPFDLMSNRDTLALIDSNILKDMRDYVAELSESYGTCNCFNLIDRILPNCHGIRNQRKSGCRGNVRWNSRVGALYLFWYGFRHESAPS